jgi:hypothetical protein
MTRPNNGNATGHNDEMQCKDRSIKQAIQSQQEAIQCNAMKRHDNTMRCNNNALTDHDTIKKWEHQNNNR